jgi:hypothetical protein
MKTLFPILAFLLLFTCCNQPKNELIVDETAKEIFSATELEEIKKVIFYVDSTVLDITSAEDINRAYHIYFDTLLSKMKNGEDIIGLVKDTVKYKFLENLNKESFEAVWRMSEKARMVKYKDTLLSDLKGYKTLEINMIGKYLDYLNSTGKTDSVYAQIVNSIQIAGDIPPSTFGWFLTNHDDFDFTNFKNRLWATVFLLRIEDPMEEKIERALRKQGTLD